jgi:aspartyl-tRNA(Asn)/glutamyl-tRNA(Gln) amidotransferase subunit C
MSLSIEDVERVANLARLSLSSAELHDMTTKLGKVVELVDELSQVDTSGVEPMVHAMETSNVLAADLVSPSLDRNEALQNAPSADKECFRVPAVLG